MGGKIVKYNYQLNYNFQNLILNYNKMNYLKQYFNLKLIKLIILLKYYNNIHYIYNKLLKKLMIINKNQV